MKSKYLLAYEFLEKNIENFECPICKKKLYLYNHYIKCECNHVFNINKKGFSCLLKNSNFKVSKIYNEILFDNRRKFIENNFYDSMYKIIASRINELYSNKTIKILDLGCGEGTHTNKILNQISDYYYIGMDYSKTAISMATSYLNEHTYYFVGDVNNLPIKDNSIDVIIDILSPYNEMEVKRVLKNNGLYIKVVPGVNYLKELREALNMSKYSPNDVISDKFKDIEVLEFEEKFKINKEMFENLKNMTPINGSIKINNNYIEDITINLKIYVVKGS